MSAEPPSHLVWDQDGAPRSAAFGDVYFSSADGLAESRAVFLQGCGLPEAWRGRDRFVVGELGFGTGLNILALMDLWRSTREPGARLNIFSIEAYPLRADEARRALSAWPELANLAEHLTNHWPGRARGFHRIDWPELNATLDLAIMDAAEALEAWAGAADAWFLDGFSPARNPLMWSEAVFAGVARRSAPGARAATFTVAGAVRRGLQAQGFTVEKRPGFGRKRERLEARMMLPSPLRGGVGGGGVDSQASDLHPHPPTPSPQGGGGATVAIIGAGIAGASLARAFRTLGLEPVVIDSIGLGAGASGNPAALVTPRFDVGGGPVAQLYAQAFARAGDLYAAMPNAVIARGALQLEASDADPSRFDRIAASDLFEPGALARLSAAEVSAALGESVSAGGLRIRDGLVVEPAVLLRDWLGEVRRVRIERIEHSAKGWALFGAEGDLLLEADVVCLAAGAETSALREGLDLSPVRGQASWTEGSERLPAAAWGGYIIPTRDGLLFGATHDRGQTDTAARPSDDTRNLTTLRQALPTLENRIDPNTLKSRASLRATTPDRLPIAGELAPGLFVLSGLGSRGFVLAPLLAEHVAALATGAPSPLPRAVAEIVDPARFERRRIRRAGGLSVAVTGLS